MVDGREHIHNLSYGLKILYNFNQNEDALQERMKWWFLVESSSNFP